MSQLVSLLCLELLQMRTRQQLLVQLIREFSPNPDKKKRGRNKVRFFNEFPVAQDFAMIRIGCSQ